MAQPPLLPAEPLQLSRPNRADYSPVELAILRGLGREYELAASSNQRRKFTLKRAETVMRYGHAVLGGQFIGPGRRLA